MCRFYFDDSLLATRSANAFLAGRTARAQQLLRKGQSHVHGPYFVGAPQSPGGSIKPSLVGIARSLKAAEERPAPLAPLIRDGVLHPG